MVKKNEKKKSDISKMRKTVISEKRKIVISEKKQFKLSMRVSPSSIQSTAWSLKLALFPLPSFLVFHPSHFLPISF